MSNTLSVTQLVRKMKTALQFEIGEIWVEGEVSNLRIQASGHRYFTIKDSGAQLSCVLFKGRSGKAGELIQNGKKVQLFGEITIYEAMGRAQMVVSKVKGGGEGDLQAKFEELKQKLNAEGLFESTIKKPLPKFPKKIGLVTSPSGAALQDMLNIFSRRAPWVELFLYGVQVQGKGAEQGITHAINEFSNYNSSGLPKVDVIIIGRGGGSIEDLWNFNEEIVARAIHCCSIPVISAVGHEIDFTIADFVADERAPTPSAAAEIATPDGESLRKNLRNSTKQLDHLLTGKLHQAEEKLEFLKGALERKSPENIHLERVQRLGDQQDRLLSACEREIQYKESRLVELKNTLSYHNPSKIIDRYSERMQQLKGHLSYAATQTIEQKQQQLLSATKLLRTLGPESTLARGYSITTTADGRVVTNPRDLKEGDLLNTKLAGGSVQSTVTNK